MGDEGAVSFFVVGCVIIFFALAGLAFDGGGRVHTGEQADAVAREAARAACEQVDQAAVLRGVFQLRHDWARTAAAAYVHNVPRTALVSVTFPRRDVCKVTVTTQYRTQLLDLIGLTNLPATGTGQATFVYGVNGIEG